MKFVPAAITAKAGRQMLKLNAQSPTLLFGVGVGGMVMSTVLACRATLKMHEVLEETQNDLNTARTLEHLKYSEEDRKKDITLIYGRTVGQVAKLYAPSIIVGVAAIGCLTKSHNMLSQRNLALAAAYSSIEEAFGAYRRRVIDKYGKEEDDHLRYASEQVEIIDGETGKLISTHRVGPAAGDMYAKFFDEYSPNWSKDPEYNRAFLIAQQNYLNDILKTRGHVFLNEAYDALGLPHTRAGSVVGWMISDDGDNFIDFGIWDERRDDIRDFVNGREGSVLLDFNVDGIIYNKIKDPGEALSWQK